jgi:RNA polymerase sigma-70 factor (ECF subfamily)
VETERQLLEAIKGGDREALRRLYNRFSEYAMAISRRYIDERDDALDVVQDSFVSILTSIGSFKYRDEGSLKAWVSRIVANKAVDLIKHHKALVFTDNIPDETEENEPDVEQVPPEILNGLIRAAANAIKKIPSPIKAGPGSLLGLALTNQDFILCFLLSQAFECRSC